MPISVFQFFATLEQSVSFAPQQTPSSSSKQITPRRIDCVRGSLTNRGVSQQANWTSGTEKQYRAVWKKWSGWCNQRNINSFQASVEEVTNFLAECFEEGKSYSTLNTYISALSSTLCSCSNTTVGSHPLVCRLLKGVFHLRPPQPRYSTTWDVSLVTTSSSSILIAPVGA